MHIERAIRGAIAVGSKSVQAHNSLEAQQRQIILCPPRYFKPGF
jgi:hypothetical protein